MRNATIYWDVSAIAFLIGVCTVNQILYCMIRIRFKVRYL